MSDKKPNNQKLVTYLRFLNNQPAGFVYNSNQKNTEHQTQRKSLKLFELEQLKQHQTDCTKCPLASLGRSQVVFGLGNPDAKLMFVGEGPGRNEDQQGIPFIGRAGQLLTKIINAMGLTREDIYISNVVKCRPPNNRTPLPEEITQCMKILLKKEIAIINPQIICAMGATATCALLGPNIRISQVRGTFHNLGTLLVMPTYHPAYLLRNPTAKPKVWEDMKKIGIKLNLQLTQ